MLLAASNSPHVPSWCVRGADCRGIVRNRLSYVIVRASRHSQGVVAGGVSSGWGCGPSPFFSWQHMAFPQFAYTTCSLYRRRGAAISFITSPPLFQPLMLLSPTPYTRSQTPRYCPGLSVPLPSSDHKVNATQKKSCQQPSTNLCINVTQNTPGVAAS